MVMDDDFFEGLDELVGPITGDDFWACVDFEMGVVMVAVKH